MDKSEAQQRNEEEVRRIMLERGFHVPEDVKSRKHKTRYSLFIKLACIVAIIITATLILLNRPRDNEADNLVSRTETSVKDSEDDLSVGLERVDDSEENNDTLDDTESSDQQINTESASTGLGASPSSTQTSPLAPIISVQTENPSSAKNETQSSGSAYVAPDCSEEEKEVDIRYILREAKGQSYDDMFNNRKLYNDLLEEANGNPAYANILYTQQKAKLDAAWQIYLESQDEYQRAYDIWLECLKG